MAARKGISRFYRLIKLEEVGRHRYLDCPYYERCLDITVKRDWTSFSCAWCKEMKK